MIVARALPGLPEIGSGHDLAQLLLDGAERLRDGDARLAADSARRLRDGDARLPADAARQLRDVDAQLPADAARQLRDGDARLPADAAHSLRDGDVLVIAHKIVSKAEGRVVVLSDVEPGSRARELAAEHGKDARVLEVILGESSEIVRSRPGVLICRTHHGYVCANAGVDASNAAGSDELVLLPLDPDASARALRARLRELCGAVVGIVVTDSFGRAWRVGQCDVAIGAAGVAPLDDWRGRADAGGRELHATVVAIADEAAAAADLARAKDSRQPAVLVRGLERHVTEADGPGAAALVRARDEDLFL